MILSSFVCLLSFLPVTLAAYHIFLRKFGRTAANAVLLVASLVFYAYYNLSYVWVIVCTVLCNYGAAMLLWRGGARKKTILTIAVCANVAFLAFFKYFNLLSAAIASLTAHEGDLFTVLLPLGISFFTFQQISFLVDTYRGETPHYSLLNYAVYVAYFPKMMSGPMVTHDTFLPHISADAPRTVSAEAVSHGLWRIAIGLCEKLLLADAFAILADYGHGSLAALSSLEAVLVILGYTLQVYFDFAGYTNMAIGISALFGIPLPENFRSPYRACDILEFWKRWHITLTNFLTKYIYYPLGGNRRGKVRTYLNVAIVFLVSGIWHGAGLPFVVWGLLHGFVSIGTRLWKQRNRPMPRALAWVLFFLFVNLSWIPFRAASLSDVTLLLSRLGAGGFTISAAVEESLRQPLLVNVLIQCFGVTGGVLVLYAVGFFFATVCKNAETQIATFRPTVWRLLVTLVLFTAGILSVPGVQSFLYVNF